MSCSDLACSWEKIAAQLYGVALSAGCRCEYERNAAAVPVWFPDDHGGIGRKLIHRCSRCEAIDAYREAAQA